MYESVVFKAIRKAAFSQADYDGKDTVSLPSISVYVILMILALKQQLKY
jgi:hypothetical protein